jgi:DNA invertase Pin-like site-specific DNA recombinase
MRAAIYARYSSDLQSAASIEDQIRICREHIAHESGTVIEIYTDYAISGGSLKNRPGIRALLDDARSARFDYVIAEALDRLSRDQEDIAAIYKRLRHADIQLLTLAEGAISELHVGLKGTMNALFLSDLAQKTRRGQRGRVEAGKIPGGNSYGYRIVRRILDDGSVAAGEREIDPEEAAIVRRIFKEYAQGLSPRQIAARLNSEGVTSPRGGQWNASTINGNRQRRNGILNNELYVGRITYNRQRFVKDPDTAKRTARPNPEHQWVTREVPHLCIIDDDLWQAVQAIKQGHSSRWGNKRQTKKRLLSGLLRCGLCGGGMTISRGDRYYCSTRREKGTCNADRGIGAPELEERVLGGLKDLLLGNEALVDEFAAEFQRELMRLRKERHGDHRRLSRELEQVERGIKRCLEFVAGGDGDPGSVRDKLRELDQRRSEITAELTARQGDMTIEIHPNLPDLYRRKVANLQQVLEDETTRPQAVETIRSLVDRIEISPRQRRGHCEVVVVGALAQVLAFVHQRTAAPTRQAGTSLMVAGACNHFLIAPASSRRYPALPSRTIAIRNNLVTWDRGAHLK